MSIRPEETEIRGAWALVKGRMEADANCRRIEALVSGHLREIGRDASGWDVLYADPDDGRFWERIYPQSDSHGGGPPLLRVLTRDAAKEKYGARVP